LTMPVVYYSQLMSVAYGSSLKQAGLDGHIIQPERLQKIAERKNNQHELGNLMYILKNLQ
jgi:hypothetical protein